MQSVFSSRLALRAVRALLSALACLHLVLLWTVAQAEASPHGHPVQADSQRDDPAHADLAHGDPAHAGPGHGDPAHGDPALHDRKATREDRERAVQGALDLAREHVPHVTAPPTLQEWLAGARYPADPQGMRLSKLTDQEKAMLVHGIMGSMEIARPLPPDAQKPFQEALKRHVATPLRDDMMVGSRRWGELKRFLAGKKSTELLFLVNALWNQFRFAEDPQTWGESEYWAVPAEFACRAQGDCDDYVMAKYLTLRELGFPVDHMRLVVGKLTRRATAPKEFHVVLRCQTEKGPFILENNMKVLQDERTSLKRFRPVYSFNEKTEWLNFAWE